MKYKVFPEHTIKKEEDGIRIYSVLRKEYEKKWYCLYVSKKYTIDDFSIETLNEYINHFLRNYGNLLLTSDISMSLEVPEEFKKFVWPNWGLDEHQVTPYDLLPGATLLATPHVKYSWELKDEKE